MSAYRTNITRKRRSDDESSSDSDEDFPSVKRKRSCNGGTNIKEAFTSKCHKALKWILNLPLQGYFREVMLTQAAAEIINLDVTEDEEVVLDDDEDIAVISDTDAELPHCDEEPSSYLRGSPNGFPKPVTTSTPFYRDGTMVGFKSDISPMDVYQSKHARTKEYLQKPQKFRPNGRCIAPISNPGLDVEILLDTEEVHAHLPEELKIVSEVGGRKQSSKFSGPLMPLIEPSDTSHRIMRNGKDSAPSTCRRDSQSSFYKGYTAHEVVRLQEKAQYGLLLDKMVKTPIYRPLKQKEANAIQVDLTNDEDDSDDPIFALPFKKEYLQKPMGSFIEKYYEPCKLVTKVSTDMAQFKKSSESKEEVKYIKPVLPEYRFKTKALPDFFHKQWIDELKSSINEETEKRMNLIKNQEDKIKRFVQRRDAALTEEKRLFEKYKVPGDVFPELCTDTQRNDYPELSEDMNNIVNAALDRRYIGEKDVLSSLNGININRTLICSLQNPNWLIDEVLNFYLNLIMERSKQEGFPTVHAFSTFFYAALKARGVNSVMRWTKKIDIFGFDILFVPLHLEVHWALCVVDNRSKKIQFLDSMGGHQEQQIKIVQAYLIAEMKAKKNIVMAPDEYSLEVVKNLPRQMNGSDCGMFTLKYAEYISRNAPITFTQAHICYFRRRMVYEILTQKLM